LTGSDEPHCCWQLPLLLASLQQLLLLSVVLLVVLVLLLLQQVVLHGVLMLPSVDVRVLLSVFKVDRMCGCSQQGGGVQAVGSVRVMMLTQFTR
jgi:hypothetical protein